MSVDPGDLIRLVLKRRQITFERIDVEIETSGLSIRFCIATIRVLDFRPWG